MSTYTKSNYFMGTEAIFVPCATPNRTPDYTSASGSDYWYTEDGVIRKSDHWGYGVASCDWYMAGAEDVSCMDWRADMCGFCAWEGFSAVEKCDVTIYGVDEAEAEGHDSMGTPYRSYDITPDMLADGYVHVHGLKVRYDRFYFMCATIEKPSPAKELPALVKTGYTYAGYHRGSKRRGEAQDFVRVDKRAVRFAGTNRVRNVFEHPVTHEEYVFVGGYFHRIEC